MIPPSFVPGKDAVPIRLCFWHKNRRIGVIVVFELVEVEGRCIEDSC
jgi:hypothetical protein